MQQQHSGDGKNHSQSPLVAQKHLNDCWIASFRMMERWYSSLLPPRPTLSDKELEALVGGPRTLNSNDIPAFVKKADEGSA
ncbi:MAG: hypothetical protein R3F37_23135 [Candidatus Competibacteraceae bacterium]